MAEKVTVRGGGQFDGAHLENAATETTLLRLLDALKGQKDGTSGAAAKAQDMYNKTIKNSTQALEDSTKKQGLYDNILGDTTKKTKELGSSMASAAASIAGAGAGLVFSGLVMAGKGLLSFFTDGMEGLRETSKVGASFNNDITLLRLTAAKAAMPLEEFTAIVGKNSVLMSQMGGTVTKGAMAFADMSKEITTSEFGKNMMMMGMTSGDLNDSLTSYLDIQMRMGRLQGKSQQELIAGSQEYIVEMDKLSKATGLNRKESEQLLASQLKEGRLSSLASRLSGDALKNFQSGIVLTGSKFKPFQDTLTNAMSGIIKPGDRFGSMMATAVPNFLSFNKALGQGKLSARDQILGYKQQASSLKEFLGRFSDEVIAANPELAKMQEYLNSLNEVASADLDSAVEEQERRNEITKAMGSFEKVFQEVKSKILSSLIQSGVFTKIENAMKQLAEWFNANSSKIAPFFEDLIGGFDKALMGGGLSDAISGAFSKLFEALKPIAMGAIRALFESPEKAAKRKELENRRAQLTSTMTENAKEGISSGSAADELEAVKRELEGMEIKNPISAILDSITDKIFSLGGLLTGGAVIGGLVALGVAFGGITGAIAPFAASVAALANPASLVGLGALTLAFMGIGKALEFAAPSFEGISKIIESVFNGVSKLIETLTAGFRSIPEVLGGIASLDAGNMLKVAGSTTALAAALAALSAGGIMSIFSKDGLGNFAQSAKLISEIDSNAINNTVSAIGNIKSIVGVDLSKQADGVKAFSDSIKDLTKNVKELQVAMEKLSKTPGGTDAATAMGAAAGANAGGQAATNASSERQEKLNTLIFELVEITKEVRDFNKDQVDAIRQRGSAMGNK